MITFLNGNFVPEEQALISVFDRSFLYGDGLFETMRLCNGKPFRWRQHLERLHHGAKFLQIPLGCSTAELLAFANELVTRNQAHEGVLRLTLSRGVGPRGYSPRGADHSTIVMTIHPVPAGAAQTLEFWALASSSFRLPPNDALAQFKTCNKLPQVMARAEADAAGAHEALLQNTNGRVVEGAASNLFWVQDGVVCTAPQTEGILPGVTRAAVLELCRKLDLGTEMTDLTTQQLCQTEGVFLSLSSAGVAQGVSLDGKPLRHSPITKRIHAAYLDLLRTESADP